MDIIFLILAFILVLAGIAGSVLPALPGLPVSWVGLLLFYCISSITMDWYVLGSMLGVVVIISVLDYVIPGVATKKFGGSKYGVWGTNIGLVFGLLAPVPLGFLWGPILGAFLGELLFNRSSTNQSLKAATGSFLGFLASTFMKFVISIVFLGILIYKTMHYWEVIF